MGERDGTTTNAELIGLAREFVGEAYEGPAPDASWFVTPRPDAGILGTVAEIDAAAASCPARPGGPSIAAHVEHLRWSLENVNATMRGAPWRADWEASWSVVDVDERAWDALRSELRREYEELAAFLASAPDVQDGVQLRGLLALAPHAAYHLGAIRQVAMSLAAQPGATRPRTT